MSGDAYLQAFPFYGGKASHLDFIRPRLPDATTYVEPFAGSATVLLSREPANVEILNDVDGDITHFFETLRDHTDELVEQIRLTPYSRSEYVDAIEAAGDTALDDIERARLFFVRASQVYAGLAQYATPGRWAYSRTDSKKGLAGRVTKYRRDVSDLEAVANRLLRVQIENDDAISVIERFDSPDALIYCDPPYPFEARGTAGRGSNLPVAYESEFSDDDHRELVDVLVDCDAYVAVSSYKNDLYDGLLADWYVDVADERRLKTKHNMGDRVTAEALYTNYDSASITPSRQSDLEVFSA